jgi:hypothetical protein
MCKRDYDVGADLPNHKTDPQEIIPYGDNRINHEYLEKNDFQ